MSGDGKLIELTANIVSAHVANNTVGADELVNLVQRVHRALLSLEQGPAQGDVPTEVHVALPGRNQAPLLGQSPIHEPVADTEQAWLRGPPAAEEKLEGLSNCNQRPLSCDRADDARAMPNFGPAAARPEIEGNSAEQREAPNRSEHDGQSNRKERKGQVEFQRIWKDSEDQVRRRETAYWRALRLPLVTYLLVTGPLALVIGYLVTGSPFAGIIPAAKAWAISSIAAGFCYQTRTGYAFAAAVFMVAAAYFFAPYLFRIR